MKSSSKSNRCSSAIQVPAQFCRKVVAALNQLKVRLHAQYEQALPGRSLQIRQAVAEAEELAWATAFPHLVLSDYAEARIAAITGAREPIYAHAA